MRFEDISQDIMAKKNRYEEERGIKTISVTPWKEISHQIYLFKGYKQEPQGVTITLFLAFRKGKDVDSWNWQCPSKETCEAYGNIFKIYNEIDEQNEEIRNGITLKDFL